MISVLKGRGFGRANTSNEEAGALTPEDFLVISR
jgi:hypothetical protein